jgi:putative sigma-54 modulation protein
MKVIVAGRNMEITDSLRKMVEEKLDKFEKYFKSDIEATATFSVQKNRQIVEITIPLKNGAMFRAEESSPDMYASIDMAVEKLQKQMSKHKTKLEKRYKGHDTIRFESIPDSNVVNPVENGIVKTKRFPVKPMDAEEAILQMELLGHNFFVFRNGETDEVNVVYLRKDGKYGLIEPTL